ncbi:MAG: Vitamin B12 transporter BtuB [Bacteroidia bacterium]|nr:Vitamin B12 transporter BtuB [Bacteroidia bacterium]
MCLYICQINFVINHDIVTMKKLILTLCIFLSGISVLSAQEAVLKGTIKDSKSGETLIGVNVVSGDKSGTVTDINGQYSLKLKAGKHKITYSFVGYGTQIKEFELNSGQDVVYNIDLVVDSKQLDLVVVTGSQYEKKVSEEVVTIDVVKPYLIQNTNATTLAGAVDKIPGVNIIDGQASIRGGSGYAYGTGSRVQLLVDEVPMLTGDFGEIRWNFVPIENTEQVEVIKGAASSLYGTGAMNGVINVRTGWAKEKPQTTLTIYQGIYSNPRREELRWWDKFSYPFMTGVFFSHRQKFDNLHVVIGANLHSLKSYIMHGDDQLARLNIKTKIDNKKVKGLSYGININSMGQQFGRVFLWENANEGAYKPFAGTQSNDYYTYLTIDPHLTYLKENGTRHSFRGRYYNVARWADRKEKEGSTNSYYLTYQYQKHFKYNFSLTAGLIYTYTHSYSNIYTEYIKTQLGSGYLQLEKKVKDRLTLLGGLRYEVQGLYQRTDSILIEKTTPLFRAGLNYSIGKGTFLRASYGQGYRIPSIAERYIQADITPGITIFKTPSLQPETGWTAELGIKQAFKINKWLGYADLALFWQEYSNMIEFLFVVQNGSFGFQSQNITKARIAGIEVSVVGQGNIGPVPVRLLTGYVFNYPADLVLDTTQKKLNVYLENFFQSMGAGVDSLNANGSILKYRSRNVARADIEFDLGKFTIGYAITYNSFMDRIDGVFQLAIPGVEEYRKLNNKGVAIMDARLAYRISEKSTVNLIVKNFTNEEYSMRPGSMEAPRLFTLQYKLNF